MRMFTLCVCLMVLATFLPSSTSQSNECEHDSLVNCGHYSKIESTDTYKISDVVDFALSGDGNHLLYTDSEKYHLVDLHDETTYSDYLMPGESIGVDGFTGNLMVFDSEACFFLEADDTACVKNQTTSVSSNGVMPPNFQGSFHSEDYVVCDLEHPAWFSSYCDGNPLKISEFRKEEWIFSPDGNYELWFSSYLVDEDLFTDDYDGVVGYGKVEQWEISHPGGNLSKSISRVVGGYQMESYLKDDVYALIWSYDSQYAYVITCQEIHGIDIKSGTKAVLGSPPITCDTDWDSVDDEVAYLPKPITISMDGSTIVYLDQGKIVVVHLEEESSFASFLIWIFVGIIVIPLCYVGYNQLRMREII